MKELKITSMLSFLLTAALFFCFLPGKGEAAGAITFDCEKRGIMQETQYRLEDDTWILSSVKKFEYYPDGTLKTVYAEGEEFRYEGHYDPHGHLMDPGWAFFTGYVEGIIYESNSMREYDSEGRLTHFEAQCLDFDTAEPYTIFADYEYDGNNRIARVSYGTECHGDELLFQEYEGNVSTGYLFNYMKDGQYSATQEERYDYNTVYRTSYAYDSAGRLVRFDSSSEIINDYDGKLYIDSDTYMYYYDEGGYLIRDAQYRNGEQTPMSRGEYQYHKNGDGTLTCNVRQYIGHMEEPEYDDIIMFSLDESGRIVEENGNMLRRYRYEF